MSLFVTNLLLCPLISKINSELPKPAFFDPEPAWSYFLDSVDHYYMVISLKLKYFFLLNFKVEFLLIKILFFLINKNTFIYFKQRFSILISLDFLSKCSTVLFHLSGSSIIRTASVIRNFKIKQ